MVDFMHKAPPQKQANARNQLLLVIYDWKSEINIKI